MAYQTLYRKYRPKSFELVYGQDVIVKTLKNIIKNSKLSHAYLFTGPRGTGKTSSAKLFAKAVNCLNNKDGDACNECENCKTYNENNNPDIIEIDAASNNGVDEIREIKNKINLVPSISKYKVYIIDEVHMLSIGAFNALLKTLEEPPEYIIFILATTEPQKIPATIISRCQRFDFKNISHDNMKKCLNNIIEKENIKINDDALDEIIINSKGGMRDAIGMLDQAWAFCNNTITKDDIESLSGNISDDDVYKLVNNLLNNDVSKILKFSNDIENLGKDYDLILLKILNILRNELINTKINKTNKFNCTDSKLIEFIDLFEKIYSKILTSSNKKIIFDVEILKIIKVDDENNLIKEEKNNVSRETLEENRVENNTLKENDNKIQESIDEVKNIKINNTLVMATKENLVKIKNVWKKLKDYLLDDNYKMYAGMLANSVPVAASNEYVLITVESLSIQKRIEDKLSSCEKLIEKILDNNIKLVCVTNDYWNENRPIYAKKIKNKEMKYIKEEINVSRETLKNKTEIDEFSEFIEMEE